MASIQENDLILIVHEGNRYLKKLEPKKSFHGKERDTRFRIPRGSFLRGQAEKVEVFEPTIEDVIMYGLRRETQIVYPKDGCYICFKLSLKHGDRVIEVGTGSGALTLLFSRGVGRRGRSFPLKRGETLKECPEEHGTVCGPSNVDLRLAECVRGRRNSRFDAAFIDVREPWYVMEKVWSALKASGSLGIIVPTTNQVSERCVG